MATNPQAIPTNTEEVKNVYSASGGATDVPVNPEPVTVPPSPQPSTNALQFYRIGGDIYESGTNRHIGPTEWGNTWSGRATEVAAPSQNPPVQPAPISPFTQQIEPVLPSETPTPTSVISSTAELAKSQNQTTQQAYGVLGSINSIASQFGSLAPDNAAYIPFSQTEEGQSANSQIQIAQQALQNINMGDFTPGQQAQIQSAVNQTAALYAPLIKQAEDAKAAGMPKAEVAVGQLGGYLNTQFAGIAALLPTQGGTFIGAGGELERINSAYDSNISQIKSQAQAAIEQAKQNAIAAIQTGAKDNLAIAQDNYDRAFNAQQEAIALTRQKQQDLINWAVTSADLQKYATENVGSTVTNMANAGISVADVPDWYFQQLDLQAGYPQGTSRGLMTTAINAAASQSQKDALENAKNLVDTLSKLPYGQEIEINGTTYTSINQGEVSVFTEDDGLGNTNIIHYNQDSGESYVTQLQGVSKKDGWEFQTQNGVGLFVNPNTQEVRVAFDANQPNNGVANANTIKQQFPDGYKPTDAELKALGFSQLVPSTGGIQCGQFVHALTGVTIPSDRSAKDAMIDKSIGTDTNPPQAGDAFIQDIGTYGHIGMVLGSTRLDDGSYQLQIVDANRNSDGTVRYRQINSKNVAGFARLGLLPEYQFGTDATGAEGSFQTSIDNFGKSTKTEVPTIKSIDGKDYQWNSDTQNWELPSVPGGGQTTQANLPAGAYVDSEGKQAKLTDGQINALSGMDGTIRVAEELVSAIDSGDQPTVLGAIGSTVSKVESIAGLRSENRIEWNAKLSQLKAEFTKAISGATVSDKEAARLAKLLPDPNDTAKQVVAKANQLAEEMTKRKSTLQSTIGIYQLIPVTEISSGVQGVIPENEFDPNLYSRM